jgi:Protein of unknown function (DUF4236)/Superinfection immunity protein
MFNFRFRKRVKLAPGLALDLSKGGFSLSVGGRGNSVNVSKRGVKQTVGLPGTGISFSKNLSWTKGQSREANRLEHLNEPIFRNKKEQKYYQSKTTDEIGLKAVSMLTPYEARIWRNLSDRAKASVADPSCYSKAELNVIAKWLKLTKHLIDSGWAPEAIDQPKLELKEDLEPQKELTLRSEELQQAQIPPPLPSQAAEPIPRRKSTLTPITLLFVVAGVLIIIFHLLAPLSALLFYIVPTTLALLRRRKAWLWILAINILSGWTLIGWIVALAWAFIGRPAVDPQPRSKGMLYTLRALVGLGVISFFLFLFAGLKPKPKTDQPSQVAAASVTPIEVQKTAAESNSSPSASSAAVAPTFATPSEPTPAVGIATPSMSAAPSVSALQTPAPSQSPSALAIATPSPTQTTLASPSTIPNPVAVVTPRAAPAASIAEISGNAQRMESMEKIWKTLRLSDAEIAERRAEWQKETTDLDETLAQINAEFEAERKQYPEVFVAVERAAKQVAEQAFKAGVVDPEKRINAYWNKNKAAITKKYGKKGAEIFQFHFETDAEHELWDMIRAQIGEMPMIGLGEMGQEPHKGYVDQLENIKSNIKRNMHDPKSYKFVSNPSLEVSRHNGQYCWSGDLKFRGKNAFGATVLNSVRVYVQNNAIVDVQMP